MVPAERHELVQHPAENAALGESQQEDNPTLKDRRKAKRRPDRSARLELVSSTATALVRPANHRRALFLHAVGAPAGVGWRGSACLIAVADSAVGWLSGPPMAC